MLQVHAAAVYTLGYSTVTYTQLQPYQQLQAPAAAAAAVATTTAAAAAELMAAAAAGAKAAGCIRSGFMLTSLACHELASELFVEC